MPRRVHALAFLGLLAMFAGLVLSISLASLGEGVRFGLQGLFFAGLGLTLWSLFEARRRRRNARG